tara:strand:- start:2917 stop:3234 length:318 start_codon:yes stop_codon:yes gene_type:complete
MAPTNKAPNKANTKKSTTSNQAPTTPVAPAESNEAPKRVGRPPKKRSYDMTVVVGGKPVLLSFDTEHECNSFFKKAAHSGSSRQPAFVVCDGKQYAFANIDYVVR